MAWAVTHGVLAGSDGRLNPRGTATRAQTAQIFYNARNVLSAPAEGPEEEPPAEEPPEEEDPPAEEEPPVEDPPQVVDPVPAPPWLESQRQELEGGGPAPCPAWASPGLPW